MGKKNISNFMERFSEIEVLCRVPCPRVLTNVKPKLGLFRSRDQKKDSDSFTSWGLNKDPNLDFNWSKPPENWSSIYILSF